MAPYLKSTTNCQVGNSKIKSKVNSVTSGLTSDYAKAEAIYNTVHGKVTPEVPASILQFHNDIVLILDEAAASKLNKEDYKLA